MPVPVRVGDRAVWLTAPHAPEPAPATRAGLPDDLAAGPAASPSAERVGFEDTLAQDIDNFRDENDYDEQALEAVPKDAIQSANEARDDPDEAWYWRERARAAVSELRARTQ